MDFFLHFGSVLSIFTIISHKIDKIVLLGPKTSNFSKSWQKVTKDVLALTPSIVLKRTLTCS